MNGRYLSGAKPFEEFAKVINAELGRLNLPVPAGAREYIFRPVGPGPTYSAAPHATAGLRGCMSAP